MITNELNNKLSKTKLLILDVDGVLTDGKITLNAQGEELISFHVHDGFGIKALQKINVDIAVISGRDTKAVAHRLAFLGIEHVFLGQKEKITVFESLLKKLSISAENIAFIGDDLPDVPLMQKVGVSICVKNGTEIAKKTAHFCTQKKGGNGAVREICDLIIMAKTA
ncbi:MAG: HAD-IIIA family hydrolase [Coxiellaceae bacterium]|nr:HAD-IIIA family hydrolase [Coxiellaceae bacterium]